MSIVYLSWIFFVFEKRGLQKTDEEQQNFPLRIIHQVSKEKQRNKGKKPVNLITVNKARR